jgi:transposase
MTGTSVVLFMDKTSFHPSERLVKMCEDAGVKLIYLPPSSPDLNLIEEFLLNSRSSFGVTGITTKNP